MKKQLVLFAVLSGLCVLSTSSFKSPFSNGKRSAPKRLLADYYQGDTNMGGPGAYAVYGTSPCCTAGTTIDEVMQYSTGTFFTATGHTFLGKGNLWEGDLTVSNGYTWNGWLTF